MADGVIDEKEQKAIDAATAAIDDLEAKVKEAKDKLVSGEMTFQ